MKILEEVGFTYDDLLIVPQYSNIVSRGQVDVSVQLGTMKLKVPIIAANMDTICEYDMAKKMGELGGLGILHRFALIEQQVEWVKQLKKDGHYAVPSIGVGENTFGDATLLLLAGADYLCLDIAHAYSYSGLKTCELLNKLTKNIIFGNIAQGDAMLDTMAPIYKIGIGPGSACETRVVAGVGYPQASAILDCVNKRNDYLGLNLRFNNRNIKFIADGGIRYPGDVAKAIALGATAVMIGGMFAGTKETPSRGKTQFRGMASSSAQLEHRGRVSNDVAEGATFKVEEKGSVEEVVTALVGGLRSAMSYTGAGNITEFQKRAVLTKVTNATIQENHPHFKG